MTQEQMDKMTKAEIKAREDKCSRFNENQTLADYTTSIRDTIYLWKYIDAHCKFYTLKYAQSLVDAKSGQIKRSFEKKEPSVYVAEDIAYCCG